MLIAIFSPSSFQVIKIEYFINITECFLQKVGKISSEIIKDNKSNRKSVK